MLDFNKIKNTKKDRLIIAINMAKIFCVMLENKMFHKDVEIKNNALLNSMKKKFENSINLKKEDIDALYYTVIGSLVSVGFNYELTTDYHPNDRIKKAFELIGNTDDISFFFPFKSGIIESYERDENQIMIPCIKTYNLNMNDKYEIVQIDDAELEEVLNNILDKQ